MATALSAVNVRPVPVPVAFAEMVMLVGELIAVMVAFAGMFVPFTTWPIYRPRVLSTVTVALALVVAALARLRVPVTPRAPALPRRRTPPKTATEPAKVVLLPASVSVPGPTLAKLLPAESLMVPLMEIGPYPPITAPCVPNESVLPTAKLARLALLLYMVGVKTAALIAGVTMLRETGEELLSTRFPARLVTPLRSREANVSVLTVRVALVAAPLPEVCCERVMPLALTAVM